MGNRFSGLEASGEQLQAAFYYADRSIALTATVTVAQAQPLTVKLLDKFNGIMLEPWMTVSLQVEGTPFAYNMFPVMSPSHIEEIDRDAGTVVIGGLACG